MSCLASCEERRDLGVVARSNGSIRTGIDAVEKTLVAKTCGDICLWREVLKAVAVDVFMKYASGKSRIG